MVLDVSISTQHWLVDFNGNGIVRSWTNVLGYGSDNAGNLPSYFTWMCFEHCKIIIFYFKFETYTHIDLLILLFVYLYRRMMQKSTLNKYMLVLINWRNWKFSPFQMRLTLPIKEMEQTLSSASHSPESHWEFGSVSFPSIPGII